MPPLFSVVVPTFNRLALLREALASVFAQQFRDYEILVADDGSTDGTVEWLQTLHQVRVFRQQNKGPGAARNLGILYATGQYIAFLDSDDLWFPWTLSTLAEIIHKTNLPSWVMGKSFEFRHSKALANVTSATARFATFPDYLASSQHECWVGGCGVAIHREALSEVDGFANAWINAEDSDLWLRLGTAKNFVAIESPVTMAYRCHPNTAIAHPRKTFEGIHHLIQQEKNAKYPGGSARKMDRLRILTRHTRPASIGLLRAGALRAARTIYEGSFWWNVRLARWKYLFGFWPRLALARKSRHGRSIHSLQPSHVQNPLHHAR